MYLTASRLTADAFSPYGEIVEHQGQDVRHMLTNPFSVVRADMTMGFTVNALKHQPLERVRVRTVERHPHCAQTFIPMVESRHLVVVALSDPDGTLSIPTLRAFITNGRQGVSYRKAVWHFAFTAIDSDSEVAVMLGTTGNEDDTEYTELDDDILIALAAQERS